MDTSVDIGKLLYAVVVTFNILGVATIISYTILKFQTNDHTYCKNGGSKY